MYRSTSSSVYAGRLIRLTTHGRQDREPPSSSGSTSQPGSSTSLSTLIPRPSVVRPCRTRPYPYSTCQQPGQHRTSTGQVTVRIGLVTLRRYDRYRPSVLNPGNALSWKSNSARFSHAFPDVGSVGSQPSPLRYVQTPSQ